MSVERRCSRLPEGRADMKNSLRKVHRRASLSGCRALPVAQVGRVGETIHAWMASSVWCSLEGLVDAREVCLVLSIPNGLKSIRLSASTSGMGTARRRLVDRSGPRGHVGQPAASQRVKDGHAGRWSSYRDSIRIVRELPEHGAAFFGRSLKVRIELEDEQPSR
jgi:hypothetical protein